MKNLKQPNQDEFYVLKRISTNDNRKKVRLRAKIILSRLKGLTYRMITKKLHCCKDTIKLCLDKWNESGIGSIITWKRKIILGTNFKRRNVLEKLLSIKPKRLKLPFTNWSLRTIRAFFADWLGIKKSISTIRRDLKILNLRYGRVEDKLINKPIDYEEKKALLTFLKRFKDKKTRLIYIDEKGPIPVIRHSGRTWSSKPIILDKRKKGKGKISFLGGFDNVDYKFEMYFLYDHTSKSFCYSLEQIVKKFLVPPYKKILLVMDNAFIHHSKYTTEFLKGNKKIDVFFLPTYSPELNPIELCFNQYQRELVENLTMQSAVHLMKETYKYVNYFNTERRFIMTN